MEWRIDIQPVDYAAATDEQEKRARDIHAGHADERVWLLCHPPILTAGTSAGSDDAGPDPRFPVHRSGRGGQVTYHGPGQRVVYVQLDLARRGRDVRGHVCALERWMVATLARFGLTAFGREAPRVGVWVPRAGGVEDKIAAIGVRVARWVTIHGVALNVAPNLDHYAGIVPCGVRGHGITSMVALGQDVGMAAVDRALMATFDRVFAAPATCAT
jgi:lipoyl(octanoyl) transferase